MHQALAIMLVATAASPTPPSIQDAASQAPPVPVSTTAPATSASPPPPPDAPAAAPIPWSATRPLRWSDFQGKVPDPPPHHAACVECTLRITADFETSTEQGPRGWRCTLKVTSWRAIALFEPSRSWVKDHGRTPELLAHEQLHFDLAHLEARRAGARIARELLPRPFSGSGPTEASALAAARARFDEIFGAITRDAHEALRLRNHRYDEETLHGADEEAQRRWSEMIAKELRDLGEAGRRPARPG